jgi:hypothetical protein
LPVDYPQEMSDRIAALDALPRVRSRLDRVAPAIRGTHLSDRVLRAQWTDAGIEDVGRLGQHAHVVEHRLYSVSDVSVAGVRCTCVVGIWVKP